MDKITLYWPILGHTWDVEIYINPNKIVDIKFYCRWNKADFHTISIETTTRSINNYIWEFTTEEWEAYEAYIKSKNNLLYTLRNYFSEDF